MKATIDSIQNDARVIVAKTLATIAALACLGIFMGALFENYS